MFNLYFAGSRQGNDEQILKHKGCRLYSFYEDQKNIELYIQEKERGPLLVDSGAFSVAHRNAVIDIDEYIAYINANPTIENFIELDVIPFPVLNKSTAKATAEKSWENYLYMIERLDDPMKILPVFHFGEDLNYFKRMLEFKFKGQHIPYICIGGRHGVSKKKQEQYFEIIFNTIQNSSNPHVKIHVLGMTVYDTLEKFPFYSADSTSYLKYAAFGMILTDLGPVNYSDKNWKKTNFRYFTDDHKERILSTIRELGYDPEFLEKDSVTRVLYNIDWIYKWSKNYQYKGPESFKKKKGLF